MGFQINESIRGFWFVEWQEGNWAACINCEDNQLSADTRFRYFRDMKAFDSADERHFLRIGPAPASNEKEKELTELIRQFVMHLKAENPGARSWELLRGEGSFDTFIEQFVQLPFIHGRAGRLPPR